MYSDGAVMIESDPKTPKEAELEPRNSLGLTWEEYRQHLLQVLKPLGSTELERELRIQQEIFARHSVPNAVAEERNRLFEEAYRAVPDAQRRHFLEVVKKSWT
jgi:hypothetical protein